MALQTDSTGPSRRRPAGVRDPLGNPAMLKAARRRPMSERLELALSWNAVAAELRAGVAASTGSTPPQR